MASNPDSQFSRRLPRNPCGKSRRSRVPNRVCSDCGRCVRRLYRSFYCFWCYNSTIFWRQHIGDPSLDAYDDCWLHPAVQVYPPVARLTPLAKEINFSDGLCACGHAEMGYCSHVGCGGEAV